LVLDAAQDLLPTETVLAITRSFFLSEVIVKRIVTVNKPLLSLFDEISMISGDAFELDALALPLDKTVVTNIDATTRIHAVRERFFFVTSIKVTISLVDTPFCYQVST
jgi:hypothetical protein